MPDIRKKRIFFLINNALETKSCQIGTPSILKILRIRKLQNVRRKPDDRNNYHRGHKRSLQIRNFRRICIKARFIFDIS